MILLSNTDIRFCNIRGDHWCKRGQLQGWSYWLSWGQSKGLSLGPGHGLPTLRLQNVQAWNLAMFDVCMALSLKDNQYVPLENAMPFFQAQCANASSCDQEHQSAQEDARQHKNEAIFIPECANGGLYKPVQCHPSTSYCWCVLVDTGRPIPGTSTRYEQPKCDGNARAHPTKPKDHYTSRPLQGCPGEKKNEFLTSVLDALSTDMVHAVSDPSSASRITLNSRISEPDPNHTLEERVVYWYFNQLDKNSSGDIGKKEIKPFKRFLRKKSKPKKCVKKFVEYCDMNNDKTLSVQELMGCLGVTKEEGTSIFISTNKRSVSSRDKINWSSAKTHLLMHMI
ncbi:SMOC2 protein, partial [Polyodon spathula]|nr:SMOC2 protein [Polyodon spathula]